MMNLYFMLMVISASFNKPKYERIKKDGCPSKLEKTLTVDIELPDNYFVNGTFNYGFKSLICIIITYKKYCNLDMHIIKVLGILNNDYWVLFF